MIPRTHVFSKVGMGAMIVILLLESQKQPHLGLANQGTGMACSENSRSGRDCLNNNKKSKVDRPKGTTLGIDIWPQHLKKNPDCPALLIIAC